LRIIIDINHPAHVYFFKNIYRSLVNDGNEVMIVAGDKEISIELLNKFQIPYYLLGKVPKGIISKLFYLIRTELTLLFLSLKFKPDLFLSIAGIRDSHIAFLLRKKSFVFDDTEHSTKEILLYKPFATKIFTPDCFLDDLGPKQVRYAGYHELAYLHPNRFTPNPEVLKEIGLTENDKFFVVRFVSWQATHDVGHKGLSIEDKRKLIETLKPHGKIIISSEKELPAEFEEYRMRVDPTKMHDLLYYATMYIGEGATMASEAACLGTYSVFINPLEMGSINEQRDKYKLIYQSMEIDKIIKHILSINLSEIKSESRKRTQQLLNNKIDVTDWMIDLINTYAPR
jgi:predicted glycosyltransferase